MDVTQTQVFYCLFYLFEIFFQILLLCLYKKEGKKKDFGRFLGITIAIFLSNIIAYIIFSIKANGLSSAIGMVAILAVSTVLNTIFLIISLLVLKKINGSLHISLDRPLIFKNILIFSLCSIILLTILPTIFNGLAKNKVETIAKDFLISKYGDHNYEFVETNEYYSNVGMWDKTLSGYECEVKADCIKDDTFTICISDDGYVKDDTLLLIYYSQKLNLNYKTQYDTNNFKELESYIRQQEGLEEFDIYELSGYVDSYSSLDGIKYDEAYYIVPADNGKIPSVEEFIKALKKYETGQLNNQKVMQ